MAAPTETYIDPADGAANGSDHGGAAFVDGSFANATNTLTKIGAFAAATCQAGDKIYLDDNGSGEVTAALYTISVRTDNDNVVLTADIRSGANDPVDVRCDQHTGAVGLPWATVQHALDFTTRDAANGDRFNVKTGTDDVLAAALDFTTYGAPTAAAPWISQGYTNAAGDGGIGGISGGGNVSVVTGDTMDFLIFIDMHLHNSGANDVISTNNNCAFINCEVDSTTARGIDADNRTVVWHCHIHNCGDKGINADADSLIVYCTFENGANDFVHAIDLAGNAATALMNIISIDGTSIGIFHSKAATISINNSIYANAGTGTGILTAATGKEPIVINNIVEGFSGIGGVGINLVADTETRIYGFNAFYNNTTNLTNNDDVRYDLSAGDQALGASPFTNPGAGDFTVKTSVKALAYPTANYPGLAVRSYLDIGALQRQEAGAGGTIGWW